MKLHEIENIEDLTIGTVAGIKHILELATSQAGIPNSVHQLLRELFLDALDVEADYQLIPEQDDDLSHLSYAEHCCHIDDDCDTCIGCIYNEAEENDDLLVNDYPAMPQSVADLSDEIGVQTRNIVGRMYWNTLGDTSEAAIFLDLLADGTFTFKHWTVLENSDGRTLEDICFNVCHVEAYVAQAFEAVRVEFEAYCQEHQDLLIVR